MTQRPRDLKAGGLTVGKFADAAGVNAGTIRFYERAGLLRTTERTKAGYRIYGSADLDRIHFIRRAKDLGFTLDEIAELLALNDERLPTAIRAVAERRLAEVESRFGEMERVRDALRRLVEASQSDRAAVEDPLLRALVPARGAEADLSSKRCPKSEEKE